MKEFQAFRTELNNAFEDLTEHVSVPTHSMPPNILILRRQTVRQFPDGVMVALYKNDKLGLQFSIPYGGSNVDPVVTPVALKEDVIEETAAFRRWQAVKKVSLPQKQNWMAEFEKHVTTTKPEHTGKIDWDTAHYFHSKGHKPEAAATLYNTRRRDLKEAAEHGVIQRLRNIKDFHSIKHITHADGTKTHVDPTTAHALLTVHDALKPEHQEKFVQHLEHSKPKFHKMLDFAWKNVK